MQFIDVGCILLSYVTLIMKLCLILVTSNLGPNLLTFSVLSFFILDLQCLKLVTSPEYAFFIIFYFNFEDEFSNSFWLTLKGGRWGWNIVKKLHQQITTILFPQFSKRCRNISQYQS